MKLDTCLTWSETLSGILMSTAGIQDLLEASYPIFKNPLFVINADFHVIASVGYPADKAGATSDIAADENLSISSLAQFLELSEPHLHVREPLLLQLPGSCTLNTNLYRDDEYIGCLTLDYGKQDHRESDRLLVAHLAHMITLALGEHAAALRMKKSALKMALQDLMQGHMLDGEQQMALEAVRADTTYLCIKMRLSGRLDSLPGAYFVSELERRFVGSILFEHDDSVVGFLDVLTFNNSAGSLHHAFEESIGTFTHSVAMHVGASDPFGDLSDARLYYCQASTALECGMLLNREERYYNFQDYALSQMILDATGEMPVEMYYLEGLRRLVEHDATSPVSYVETLRVYLEQSKSIAKTAKLLFVHRSTLLERITRIERELDMDLEDPDERLRIHLLLKAAALHGKIRGK